jgi:hypothetical protein
LLLPDAEPPTRTKLSGDFLGKSMARVQHAPLKRERSQALSHCYACDIQFAFEARHSHVTKDFLDLGKLALCPRVNRLGQWAEMPVFPKRKDRTSGSGRLGRGDLTKGQKAIGWAILYPEPDKGGRGTKGKASETDGFSATRLKLARAVLRHSEAIRSVRRPDVNKLLHTVWTKILTRKPRVR